MTEKDKVNSNKSAQEEKIVPPIHTPLAEAVKNAAGNKEQIRALTDLVESITRSQE